ncbi:MAG: methyltransferase domain-containing protein, partial [Syntrophales bacterium]|nr:methyltransferase domain-containing protein [Syntrophales bacterium]
MNNSEYVHGYSEREENRLYDQAGTLAELLHGDTLYPPGCLVLEAGCGVGAQTVILAANNPETRFLSIDISDESLARARELVQQQGFSNVDFQNGNIYHLDFADAHFDHIFVCFVLEHLANPLDALRHLKRVLKPGGSITVIEGDHGSAYFHPDSAEAKAAIQCLIDIQAMPGGNSLIGRQLFPLLKAAGFGNVRISPRMVYVDAGRPHLVEGFTKNTFTAMVEGMREKVLSLGMMEEDAWNKGIRDLYRTAEGDDGVFCYTFFKG